MWAVREADQDTPKWRLLKSRLSLVPQSLEDDFKSRSHKLAMNEPSHQHWTVTTLNTERALIVQQFVCNDEGNWEILVSRKGLLHGNAGVPGAGQGQSPALPLGGP